MFNKLFKCLLDTEKSIQKDKKQAFCDSNNSSLMYLVLKYNTAKNS